MFGRPLVSSVLRCVWCGLVLVSYLILILHVGVTAECSAGLLVCSFGAFLFIFILFAMLSATTSIADAHKHKRPSPS